MELNRHPRSPESPIHRIEVDAERVGGGGLSLTYRAFGDLADLRLPGGEPGRTDELWRHTCFEAFLRPVGGERYLEFNFNTALQWATYRFGGYRTGMTPANIEPWETIGVLGGSHVEMTILAVPGRMARPDLPASDWQLGLCAVIEDVAGSISYWALTHPSEEPDFHHPESFVLDLPALEPA